MGSRQHLWIGANCLVLSSREEVEEAPEPFDPQSHLAERSELVDGKFPDWRKVLPVDTGDVGEPWVNGAYLALFSDVVKALHPGAYLGGGIHLARTGEHSSIIVRVLHEEVIDKFFGLVMPMRGENLKSKVPAFARPTKQEGVA